MKIDYEAHFLSPGYVKRLYERTGYPRMTDDGSPESRRMHYSDDSYEPFGPTLFNRLSDIGAGRLDMMDQFGVDVQVLSLSAPGVEPFEAAEAVPAAIESNNELAEAIARYPDRFKGYAALPIRDVDASVKELERCVKELGFTGWKTHSNYGEGGYLDEKKYWPVLAKAEELNIPIYLHPSNPMIPQLRTYGFALAGAPFGFGVETAMVAMRLILSGALDAFPKLKILLGHYGEGLPFIIKRVNFPYVRKHFDPSARPAIKRLPGDYIKDNFWVTTSGNTLEAAFVCTRDAMGLERIILGCDYPYEDLDEIMGFLNGLPISEADKNRIFSQNAVDAGIF
jgi:predicted TIM-barrel fold metal-dependent hydrolase